LPKFSPEFELVTSPGQAYEAEFPMEDSDLEAFKFAGQWTATDEPFFKVSLSSFFMRNFFNKSFMPW
jgi:hypothetical protein